MPQLSASSGRPGVEPAPPCTVVIFGAGGDLTKRLLMPALYNLAGSGLLDAGFKVIGVDHQESDDRHWRQDLTAAMKSFAQDPTAEFHAEVDDKVWDWVGERLAYLQADFAQAASYQELGQRLSGNVVFYLAVAARFFGPIVDQLGQAGLLKEAQGAFRRVVIEKPFGADLASAQALNARILKVANESQFFRIDHFLGKETVQSIMAVRFANGAFEPTWRREFVDHVQITAAETVGVEERGAFYEPTGALRDMVPNHLFQLLCMTAMEPPNSFAAEAVRNEKAKLVEAIRPVGREDVVFGQYAAGAVQGQDVKGYREEPQVAQDSRTETFVAMKLDIENWRWGGVPFYLRTGKRLGARRTEIAVHFRPAPYRLFRDLPASRMAPMVVTLLMDPAQGVRMTFNAKVPGPRMDLGRVYAHFDYGEFFKEEPNVGYETLIYDCMMNDATLFQRADNIEAGWAAVQPALDAWACGSEVQTYAAGSDGPEAAAELLARDGRRWGDLAG